MRTQSTIINEDKIRSTSRRSAMISLLGLVLIIASLAYSAIQLTSLRNKIDNARHEFEIQNKQLISTKTELDATHRQLRASREAVSYVTQGINLYHQRLYSEAVEAYGKALSLDPQNPYILNLRGYSLFKANQLDEAISSLKRAVELDPTYAWGFFDLARVLCAKREYSLAQEAASQAASLRPVLKEVMQSDGEFTRLCKPIVNSIKMGDQH